ncbi:putative membrane protein [Sphingomonas kyeonggiensis]|uniref:Putative membrane protein n=1 Tax=Sphingomonas kyeonggiensis TaxID=1268553 RepID=A0A7W7NSQ6_9SPHN|nr:PH domain-containing protein [Sphingomonas kyeonggiensis]MBB4838894.1 putative membrane protein [Sphingomonas kyeonggiensis]
MTEAEARPQRLHVLTVILRFIKRAPSTLVVPPLALGFAGKEFHPVLAFGAFGAIAAAVILMTFLDWWCFTYRIGAEEVLIQQGVLRRSRRSIPRARIQDVSIERGPFARIVGLALVKLETGGGEKEEAHLDSVSLAEAERLRALLRSHSPAAVAQAGDAAAPEPAPERRTIFAMSLGRVLIEGVFGFSLVWIAAIYGGLHYLGEILQLDWEELFGEAQRVAVARFSIVALVLVAGLALLVSLVAGIVRTLLRDYGFTLTHEAGRFRRVRGLLTRSEVVIADRRIQLGLVHRGMISGRLGWNSVEVQTLGGSTDPSGRQGLAPFATKEEAAEVLAATPLPTFERVGLRPVAPAHILRSALRHGMPVALVFAIAGWFLPLLWWGLLLVPVPVIVALFQRAHHRYALRDTSLQVMRGVLSQRDWVVPFDSIQTLTVRQGLLQRWLGVATVSVDTAGASGWHRPNVSDAPLDAALALAEALAAKVD